MKTFIILFIFIVFSQHIMAQTSLWSGNSDSDWSNPDNWEMDGLPDSTSIVIIEEGSNPCVLDQTTGIAGLNVESGTLDLNGYTLLIRGGACEFTGGEVINGSLEGDDGSVLFAGTYFDARVRFECPSVALNGGTFDQKVYINIQGISSDNNVSSGGCVFNDSLLIEYTNNDEVMTFLNMEFANEYHGPVKIVSYSNYDIEIASQGMSVFYGDLYLITHSTGKIIIGNSGSSGDDYNSTLSDGVNLYIESYATDQGNVTLIGLIQEGFLEAGLEINVSNQFLLNLYYCIFNSDLRIEVQEILFGQCVFNGPLSVHKTGANTNTCYGQNIFNDVVNITNTGDGELYFAGNMGDIYNGNLFLSGNGKATYIGSSGTNHFRGNITVIDGESNNLFQMSDDGVFIFDGNQDQHLNHWDAFNMYGFKINKSGGKLKLNAPVYINNLMTLFKGNIVSDTLNLLNIMSSASVIGASDSSFVEGPVKKIGNTAFEFPVGKGSSYRPLNISAPDSVTDAFISEFMNDSVLVNTGDRDSTLGTVLRNKYWNLFRNSGNSQVYVALTWDTINSLVDTFVVVSGWDGTKWKNLGKGNLTGNNLSGNIKAATLANTYEEFSIGYLANSLLSSPYNCSSVSSSIAMQGCLIHAAPGTIINITMNTFIPTNPQLPMIIPSGTTLQGFVGGVSPMWWEPNCPEVSTDHTAYYEVGNLQYFIKDGALYALEPGAIIRNLKIRGAKCNYQDFNSGKYLGTGIYVENNSTTDEAEINNCEISCFNNAGIWKTDLVVTLNLNNCYIHKVKGRSYSGIGYGAWLMGDAFNNAFRTVNFKNCIFDDCKAAIDGQGDPNDWIINDCTFSQFFLSEDINKHNDNRFKKWNPNNDLDYFYCYSNSFNTCSMKCFYGPVCDDLTVQCSHIQNFSSDPGYTTDWVDCSINPDIPVYDVGGGNTRILNSIFHKKWNIQTNGNINLTLPNWDETNNRFGNDDFEIELSQNTFATDLHDPSQVADPQYNNKAGYARIADNYIEACVWSGETRIIKSNNDFSYTIGVPVTSPAVQPFELSLDLKSGGNSLNQSFTPSPSKNIKNIQYVEAGSSFSVDFNITNPIAGIDEYFIVRRNPNDGTGIDANVISADNYFFDNETITSVNSASVTYNQPGLYGIDVLGFDAQDYGSGERKFKASSWQHIPVIVVDSDPDEEQILYFNIKDSYQSSVGIDAYKEVRLNDIVIWSEKISDGGTGWEYVRVDLKDNVPGETFSIKSLINVTGTANVLSFDVFIDSGVDYQDLAGLFVWVDDVYIKKANSSTGDNLIADGSIELGGVQGLGGTSNSNNFWFSNFTPATYTCNITLPNGSTATFNDNAERGINGTERKSGNYALSLTIPQMNQCNISQTYNSGIAASIGTKIDFTDFLSCDDYSDQGFMAFPEGPYLVDLNTPVNSNPQPNTNYYIEQNVVLANGDYLKLAGCQVVIDPDILITVNQGATLEITNEGPIASHLFSCGDMWGGIVNAGGNVKIRPDFPYHTKIEDAKLAIFSNGGTVKIRFAEFDHNYIGILLANGNFDYSSSSSSEGLFGIKFKCTDGVISRNPFLGIPTPVHLQLENVIGVNIGSSGGTNGAYKNEFSDASYAIISNNSSALIQNNYFNNLIENSTWCFDCGVGVKITNSGNSTRVVEIGGSTVAADYERNYFANVNKGIYSSNVCPDCILHIKGNSFNNSEFEYTTSGNFYNTAITIQNPISFARVSPPEVEISGNTITDYRIGIHGENIRDLKIIPDAINNVPNRINFNLGETPSLTDQHIGIYLQNCHGALIRGSFDPASSNIANIKNNVEATGTTLFKGIDITTSVNCRINCNFIENIPLSMRFFDNCNGTILRQNNMTEYDVAIQMDNAEIGTQKQIDTGNQDEPANNYWYDAGGSNRVGGTTTSGAAIKWFYDDVNNMGELIPVPADLNVVAPEPDSPPGSVDCADISNRIGRDELYGKTVDDSLEFSENVNENNYLAKVKAFEAMKNDSTLIIQSTSRDSAYFDFYNLIRTSNIALFDSVLTLAADTSQISNAISLNAAITDTNNLEYYRKSVNAVYLNTIAQNIPLDESDSSLCYEISILAYHIAGDAIYTAAAMIGKEIHQQSISARMMNIENQQLLPQPKVLTFTIVPNPANSFFQIRGKTDQLKLIQIISSDGKIIREYSSSLNLDLSVENLKPSLYHVKLTEKSGTSHFLKLILIR